MANPKVSVIIPVYNTAPLLSRCLESVINQSMTDIEIICVNDGSTDSSPQILDNWAERDSRIKVIHQTNGRQGKARNAGMDIAQGEYIGMIDSDDYIPSTYFESLYNAAQRHDADIAVCGIIKQKQLSSRLVIQFDSERVVENAEEKLRTMHCPPDFHPVNKLYRREMLQRINLRFTENIQYEDVMFVTRALCESGRMVTVPKVKYIYVLNPSSTVKSRQTAAKQFQKYVAHRDMVEYLDSQGISFKTRYRTITVSHYTLCGICIWKIKERDKRRIVRLFDVLPIWSYKV